LDTFSEIHSDVKIKAISIPKESLRIRYETAARDGLGPDILLGPSLWIKPLADAGLIQPTTRWTERVVLRRFFDVALDTVIYNDRIYGLPESLRSMALYYNTKFIDTPAQTLDELVAQADAGHRVAMSANFLSLFWGIQAFGGQLFDEENRVILNKGGFANWLLWLKAAQDSPYISVGTDLEFFTAQFADANLAYLIDSTESHKKLTQALGTENLGVAALPSGPIGPAGPFIETNAFMFSSASSPNQIKLAKEVIRFVTTSEQQTRLMRWAGRISANQNVRVNPSVDTSVNTFISQARNGIPRRHIDEMAGVLRYGDEAYNRVLRGVTGPSEVVSEFTQSANRANGLPFVAEEIDIACTDVGVLTLWHDLDAGEAPAFEELIAKFYETCPGIRVRFSAYTPDELRDALAQSNINLPDIFLIHSQYLTELAQDDLARELTTILDDQLLQTYYPPAVDALRYKNLLYGVPYTMLPQILFYNKLLVEQPPISLDELQIALNDGATLLLDSRLTEYYWGITAFGGQLFDQETNIILDQAGFTEWLAWLKPLYEIERIQFAQGQEQLLARFSQGDVAYFVGRSDFLPDIESAISSENVGMALLPIGPQNKAVPLLTARGFMLSQQENQARAERQTQLAIRLLNFMTNAENQTSLIDSARQVPISVGAVAEDPVTIMLLEQVALSTPYPNHPRMLSVQTFAESFIEEYLGGENGEATPTIEEWVAQLTAQIKQEEEKN